MSADDAIDLRLGMVTVVVREYDEAIAFFVDRLGCVLTEDTPVPEQGKRWVVVQPSGGGCALLLARAADADQRQAIGRQAAGRVCGFFHTADFDRTYARLCQQGVRILRLPQDRDYGTVAVFADLYGNAWDLIGPRRDVGGRG